MSHLRQFILILLLGLSLAACAPGQATPQLIASYPSEGGSQGYSPPAQYVYDAYLELEVRNVESAAERAEELAGEYGGYLERSQSWRSDGSQHASLVLAVPAPNFEALLDRLAGLGTPLSQNISGQWVNAGSQWAVYSEITLQLHQKGPNWPSISLGDWQPLHTLQQALGVSANIFGFLLDVLIWVLVVIGPFALLAWGLRRAYQKLRAR
jgi:hypothetical protein